MNKYELWYRKQKYYYCHYESQFLATKYNMSSFCRSIFLFQCQMLLLWIFNSSQYLPSIIMYNQLKIISIKSLGFVIGQGWIFLKMLGGIVINRVVSYVARKKSQYFQCLWKISIIFRILIFGAWIFFGKIKFWNFGSRVQFKFSFKGVDLWQLKNIIFF